MRFTSQLSQLNTELSTFLPNCVAPELCTEAITRIEKTTTLERQQQLLQKYISEFENLVFNKEVCAFFESYYQQPFRRLWPIFDIIDDNALSTYVSTTWHLDSGITGMLKLFVYLNPVAEHGCNTLFVDELVSNKLHQAGALPLEIEQRKTDISADLKKLDINGQVKSYDLATGDALVFSPIKLAHRCQPPKLGKKRYTICYSVVPSSAMG